MKKNILISTGGTGGHVVPAEVLNEHLKQEFNVHISTDLRGLKYLNKEITDIVLINTPKLNLDFLIFFKFFKVIYLIIKSYLFLKNQKIEKVLSTGGYMSLPICISAKLLKLEIYLFEPNVVLGRANKFFLKFCEKIFSYNRKLKNFPNEYLYKIEIIPPLVRKKFFENNQLNIENEKFCCLVVGGSQGSKIFDNIIQDVIISLSKNYRIKIIQQTEQSNIVNLKKVYEDVNVENVIFDFKENFADLIKESDLCITRAGATTLAEISTMNRPFLAVPLKSSKDNHQHENATFYENLNCCWVMSQNNFDKINLERFLNNILRDKTDYSIKKKNLKKLNFQNTWNDVNQKLLETINEN